MFTWIWVFLLYSWKIETLFLKLEYQKLQTMQLKKNSLREPLCMYSYGKQLVVKANVEVC